MDTMTSLAIALRVAAQLQQPCNATSIDFSQVVSATEPTRQSFIARAPSRLALSVCLSVCLSVSLCLCLCLSIAARCAWTRSMPNAECIELLLHSQLLLSKVKGQGRHCQWRSLLACTPCSAVDDTRPANSSPTSINLVCFAFNEQNSFTLLVALSACRLVMRYVQYVMYSSLLYCLRL